MKTSQTKLTDIDKLRLFEATATPNKAQHSPFPWTLCADPNGWTLHANGSDIMTEAFDCSDADAKLIVASVNHADKLAEALRGIVAALTQKVQWSDGKGGAIQIIQGDCAIARNMAREALAAYEAAQ